MTVTGPISPAALGVTLAHEHLFIDLRNQYFEPGDPARLPLAREKVADGNTALLRKNPYLIEDNLLLDNVELAVAEADLFRRLGGRTLVDCTSLGIKRAPRELQLVAQATGLNIIAGCGYYTADTHPAEFAAASAEEIADGMIRDLLVGMDGTEIKAGIIGEIGTSSPIHDQEHKSLLASALAYHQTGAAIYIHTFPWAKEGVAAVRSLIDQGVDPQKIVVCHIDVDFDLAYLHELLALGVFLEFDDFGKEFQLGPQDGVFAPGGFASDAERVRIICQLGEGGYAAQLLMTTDICFKSLLHHFGGHGYGHILSRIVPMLREAGASEEMINRFLVSNPRRLLAK